MEAIDEVRRFLADLIGPADTPIARRIEQAKAFAEATPLPDGVTIAAAERGGVPVEWVIPAAADLYCHGGRRWSPGRAADRAGTPRGITDVTHALSNAAPLD